MHKGLGVTTQVRHAGSLGKGTLMGIYEAQWAQVAGLAPWHVPPWAAFPLDLLEALGQSSQGSNLPDLGLCYLKKPGSNLLGLDAPYSPLSMQSNWDLNSSIPSDFNLIWDLSQASHESEVILVGIIFFLSYIQIIGSFQWLIHHA